MLLALLCLAVLLGVWRSGVLLRGLPRPVACSAEEPQWLKQLVDLSRDLDWPGFQLSYVDPQGSRVDCAIGWAGSMRPMQVDHIMRYASLSKLFTSLVMAQLFVERRLGPDDLLVARLGGEVAGAFADARVGQITLNQLLRHTAGFDRLVSADPMLVAQPWCPGYLERLRLVRLDHAPGSHYAYSNLGYCLLGAVIAKAEGEALEQVYRRRLFAGQALPSIAPVGRGEVRPGEPARYFEFPESQDALLAVDYESFLAIGAWTGTARDLLSLLMVQFDGGGSSLLELPPCNAFAWRGCHGPALYAFRQPGSQLMYWRDGSLPGVSAFAGFLDDGSKIVVLANGRHVAWKADSDRLGQAVYRWLH